MRKSTAMLFGAVLPPILLLFVVTTCHHTNVTSRSLPPISEEVSKPGQKIAINFYLDTSISMRYFLEEQAGRANYFNRILTEMDGILSTFGPDKTSVKYWSFGNGKPEPMNDLHSFLNNPKAFSGTKTFIDQAIEHNPPATDNSPQLKIVVTDLYQNDNDEGRLAKLLNEKYLSDKRTAVGLLALRNPFDGPVDDMPGRLPKGGADSMPLYFLVTGPSVEVREFKSAVDKRFELGGLNGKQKLEMIFGSEQTDKRNHPLKWRADCDKAKGTDAQFCPANPGKPGYSVASDTGIPLLKGHSNLEIRMINLPSADITNFGPHLSANPRPVVNGFTVSNNTWVTDQSADSAGHWDSSSKTLTVDYQQLHRGTVYLFRLNVLGEEPSDLSYLSNWNLEGNQVAAIQKAGHFDSIMESGKATYPGKTPNLRHFIQTLSGKMFQSKGDGQPPIVLASYYLYFQPE